MLAPPPYSLPYALVYIPYLLHATGTVEGYNQSNTFRAGNILNHAQVVRLDKDSSGQIRGVVFRDRLSGKEHSVDTKCVVNCTGVFADEIRRLDDATCKRKLLPVAGSHVSMPLKFSNKKYGLLSETSDGRVIFLLPWLRSTLVGTTEKKMDEPVLNPKPSFEELEFITKTLMTLYTRVPVTEITENMLSKWTGIRPLVLQHGYEEGAQIDSKKVARTHIIDESPSGLISVLGGKWTIYRLMGEQTVDKIEKYLSSNTPPPLRTERRWVVAKVGG